MMAGLMRHCRLAMTGIVAALALTPALADNLPTRPDDARTPGAVSSTNRAEVCGMINGRTYSQRHRQTSTALKSQAYAVYRVQKAGRDFEIDHRVPLCLGGADAIVNLWPQWGWEHPSYHDKDRLEAYLCRAVCRTRKVTLQDAQAIFLGDWIAGFEQIYRQPPR